MTYSSGILDVNHHHGQLFVREKAPESQSLALGDLRLRDRRDVANPLHGVCLGKQHLHQLGLVRQENIDLSVTQLAGPTGLGVVKVPGNGTRGVGGGLQLDVDVEGLSGDPAHDDMDGFHVIVQNTRVSAKEGEDLVPADLEGNL